MCRWVAYSGPEIYLEDLLFHQSNSIISQSLSAKESAFVTNGDGFGVAWYNERTKAGVFKDVLPAWNDSNLKSLAAHIKTRLFFAHVRATTGTQVSRANCHPFIWNNWTFMHNGQIGNWPRCRKTFEQQISGDFFSAREGTTDSEAMFLLALSLGLQQDPIQAVGHMIQLALAAMKQHDVTEPFRATISVSDGKSLWAFRYASDDRPPSLYFGNPSTNATSGRSGPITTITSEPTDQEVSHWTPVAAGSAVHLSGGELRVVPIPV
jgi:glutamine amidotransferase